LASFNNNLVVKKGKAGDHVKVSGGGHQVLAIVTEQLQHGEHGNTSMLELRKLGPLLNLNGTEGGLAAIKVSQDSPVVNGANGEDDLEPAKSGEGINGGNAVGDIRESEARGGITRKGVELRDDVSDNAKLGDTSVLELGSAVLVKGGLVNVFSKAPRVIVSSGFAVRRLVIENPTGQLISFERV
jgi:hypothetical protein